MVTGWKKAKIGELTDIVNGGTPSTAIAEYWNGGINWCTPSDITKKKTKYLSNTEKTITEKGLSESSASLLPIGTILLCSRATIGEMSIAASEMATNQGFKNLICKKDVDNEFLYYALFPLRNKMLELAIGTTFLEISKSALQSIEVIIPADIIEQTAIAGALSDVDSLISSLQKLIEKKNAIKQGAMQELLTGKKRLPGFDEEWRTYKLGELGSFDKGCGISRAESNTGNFPAVRYGELYTKHTDYVKQYYSCISGDVAQTAKRVTFGDILFAASGETKEEIGVCAAIVDRRDIFAGGDIVVFTPTTEINPIFFGTLLNMPFVQKQKSERGQGDAVVHIHADSLSEIIISMPEKNEQEAIATVIKDFNDEIEQLERKLAKYQQIKQGMMQELLTGRIRLVDADDKEQLKTQIFQEKQSQPAHNQHFDDAVMIAGIVNAFYSEKYPLGRKKVQKLLYLVRRKEQADISAFHKKAAGPYADEVRYKGGEPIAQKNKYIQVKRSEKGSRFEKGVQMQQALTYLQDWGKQADIDWLVSQFQYTSVNELELLTTVDMAICDLHREGKEISVASIKDLIRSNKEWRDKLKKAYFKDADIQRAIKHCQELFPDKEG